MTEEEILKAYRDDIITLDIANQLRRHKDTQSAIEKAYEDGTITLEIANRLRQEKKNKELAKENSKRQFDRNKYINKEYSKGELSVSDTIAYKTMLLLKNNRKNTSLIATILSIQFAISILSVIIYLI
jgi:3-deoxy-D-arabino-heptulosonate 7-phosphate (DAHP) synthase class II